MSSPAPASRNHAPLINDRRRSLLKPKAPSSASRRGKRRSVADMAAELRLKDLKDDEADTDTDKADTHDTEETFEDASSTPRPTSTDPEPASASSDDALAGAPLDNDTKADTNHDSEPDLHDKSTPSIPEEADESVAKPEQRMSFTPGEDSLSRERSLSPRKPAPSRVEQGLSGDVSIPLNPPPRRPSNIDRSRDLERQHSSTDRLTSPPAQAPGLARKASSGFGALLGRMGSIRKPSKSPAPPRSGRFSIPRRDTAASTASLDPSIVADGKPSLQDQFSNLRRQEEFSPSAADGHASHLSDDTTQASPPAEGASSPPSSPLRNTKSPPLDLKLPPGTAAGVSIGPAEVPREVNWDLWQQLVYEGPAAVARTSGEEMNLAITAGIPPAIRGVVWQVLAESKSEELEGMYRTLKARGTDAEQRPAKSRANSTIGANGMAGAKSGVTSDSSSEHSNHSAAVASTITSPPASISVEPPGPELHAKLLAEKQKREAAAVQKLEKAIKRDLGTRTSYSKFTQSAGLQDGLFGVCKAYALFDEGVGYAQGINFIAMPLLFNMAEEEAFTLLVRLMNKYDLRSMFTHDMRGLHLRLYQFERLLEEYEPAIYCHLKRKHVEPQLYATQWFLTLFAYRFPLQLVLRIYDLILSEGLSAILKFGIVLMQRNRQALLDMKDMSQLTNFLKEKLFDVYIDRSPSASSLLDSGFFGSVSGGADKELYRADEMVRDACSIILSETTLKAYAVEWDESQRIERERETELESHKVSNAQLTARCKVLEERVQQHDLEHVTMAQDLVKVKVENDRLQDANEALQTQVTELQKMVDLQPAEVEQKLKQEMDRIMQRNIEVQNENRNLKEEQDEMEHELVQTKMAHAQVQSDLETLKQKWQGLQNLMSEKQT